MTAVGRTSRGRRPHYGSSMPSFSLLISPRLSTTWPRPLSWTPRQSFEYLSYLCGFRFRRHTADDPAWVREACRTSSSSSRSRSFHDVCYPSVLPARLLPGPWKFRRRVRYLVSGHPQLRCRHISLQPFLAREFADECRSNASSKRSAIRPAP